MFEILLIVVLFSMVAGVQWWWDGKQLDMAVKDWCGSKGLVYLGHTIIKRPHRRGRYGPFQPGRVRIDFQRGLTGELEGGSADWNKGAFGHQIIFDRVVIPNTPERALPEGPMPFVADGEENRLAVEVARRLDSITQKPGWIAEHDLDGSGHIDSEEWDILRERVIAEVRAEFEVAGAERNRASVPVPQESQDEGWW